MPDLDPDQLARIAKTVSDLYGDAVARMLSDVAKRMAAGIDEPGWAERKLLDLVRLRADAETVVAELQRTAGPAVQKAIEESFILGSKAAASELELTGSLSPRTNSTAVEALARETITKLRGTHGGILRAADDIFRQVTAEVGAAGVVTGTDTRREAAQRALNRYADHGISGFVDGRGRNWEIETYAEMTTRTSSGRAMIDGRLEVYVADGREFVIVSDSPQECKLCRPFEGKGLSISGNGVGTTVGGIRIVDTIDGARAAGLQHPNCRHDLRPIIPGLTEKPKGTEDPEGDRLRQEQRRLERGVRQWKRREAVALTDDERAAARAKVREWQGRVKTHVDEHGLKRQRQREQLGRAR